LKNEAKTRVQNLNQFTTSKHQILSTTTNSK